MGVLQQNSKTDAIGPNPGPSSSTTVELYHPAAGGDLDLGASPVCHPSGTAVLGMDSVYVCLCLQQWTIACQAPGLAPLRAEPNASVIALQGKWGLRPSTAEQATGWRGLFGFANYGSFH